MKDRVEVACKSGSGNGRLSEICCRPAIMAIISELGTSFLRLEMSVVLAVARTWRLWRRCSKRHGLVFRSHRNVVMRTTGILSRRVQLVEMVFRW